MNRLFRSSRVLSLPRTKDPPLIKIPIGMEKDINKIKQKAMRKEIQNAAMRSASGIQSYPVISCKRKQLNHYQGQTYSKLKPAELASKGWFHKKSAKSGDFFTICNHGVGPFWDHGPKSQNIMKEFDFRSLDINPKLVQNLTDMSISAPTNIQALSIPEIICGKNVLCCSETGNGKTLAYLLPLLHMIMAQKAVEGQRLPDSPLSIVLAPSIELVRQIGDVCSKVCKDGVPVTTGVLVGRKQLCSTDKNVDLLISTPAALKSRMHSGMFLYARHVVLDEVDTLLDDSFIDDVTDIMQNIKFQLDEPESFEQMNGTQLVFVGATLPQNLRHSLSRFGKVGTMKRVTTQYLHRVMPHVPQKFLRLGPNDKAPKALEMAKMAVGKKCPTIFFTQKSSTCIWLHKYLQENDVESGCFNSTVKPEHRDKYLERFRNGDVHVLVATDLASRGLDTINVKHIINYDMTTNLADYIHRVGRVGRVGSVSGGKVTNFVSRPGEIEQTQIIESAIRNKKPLPKVDANIKRMLSENEP